jgi:hypothetical protein
MAPSPELPAIFPGSAEHHSQALYERRDHLFKQAVEVNMNNASGIRVQQDVLAMPIPQSMMRNLELVLDK